MRVYISGRPAPHLHDLMCSRSNQEGVYPFTEKKCYYFFSARYALLAGIRALGIGPNDNVLVPAYNCGTELDPFLEVGARLVFYNVRRDLKIDLDDLRGRTTGTTKAVLATHYLGFPQAIEDVRGICLKEGLYLIEDCAHALLSNQDKDPLGAFGDISVFSMQKTLPVPNGGALVVNNPKINYQHSPIRPSVFSTYFQIVELLNNRTRETSCCIKDSVEQAAYRFLGSLFSLMRFLLAGYRKVLNHDGLYLVRPDSEIFREELSSWDSSELSRKIIRTTRFGEVKSIRRRNFQLLLDHFFGRKEPTLPFTLLPEGVCPLFFPVMLDSASERERLYRALRGEEIVTHPWWQKFHAAVPWQEFPDAVYLKQQLFGLPIHQDLEPEHLDRIIHEFDRAYNTT